MCVGAYVYTYLYVCVHVYMHVSAHLCGGHRLTPGVFYFFLTVFLEGLSLNLDLTRLAGQKIPGSVLSLPR